MLDGDCVQVQMPGTYASSASEMVFVFPRFNCRLLNTFKPTVNSRSGAPAAVALPVTTTRSSTLSVLDISGGSTGRAGDGARGASTTWSPPTGIGETFVPANKWLKISPTGCVSADTHTSRSSGRNSAL